VLSDDLAVELIKLNEVRPLENEAIKELFKLDRPIEYVLNEQAPALHF
jgi:hypothetical protein